MMKRTDFAHSNLPEPHRDRTKQILKAHPDVRAVIGKNPYTVFAIILIVAIQVTLAIWLKGEAWWLMLLVAYFIGAFANHAGYMSAHIIFSSDDDISIPGPGFWQTFRR